MLIGKLFSSEETEKPNATYSRANTSAPISLKPAEAVPIEINAEDNLAEFCEDTQTPATAQQLFEAGDIAELKLQTSEAEFLKIVQEDSNINVEISEPFGILTYELYDADTGNLLYKLEEEQYTSGDQQCHEVTLYGASSDKIKKVSTEDSFYKSGAIQSSVHTEENFKEGETIIENKGYYENGNKKEEGFSKHNKEENYSEYTYYYPDGTIQKEDIFQSPDSEIYSWISLSKTYAENGVLIESTRSIKKFDGTELFYTEETDPQTGALISQYESVTDSQSECESKKTWDTDGNILEEYYSVYISATDGLSSCTILHDPENPENAIVSEYFSFAGHDEGERRLTRKQYENGKLIAEEFQDTWEGFGYAKYYDTDGSLIYSEEYTTSDTYGVLSHVIKDANGNIISVLSKDNQSKDSVTIKKDFTSPNGEHTIYEFQEYKDGNSSLTYTIVDASGTTIMDTHRSYQNIDENTARSTYNGTSYLIDRSSNKLVITNENDNTQTVVDLDELVTDADPQTAQAMKDFLKQQPADVLLDLQEEIYGISTLDECNGSYYIFENTIRTYLNSAILDHELGHALSYEAGSDTSGLIDNEEFLSIYDEELEAFLALGLELKEEDVSYLFDITEFFAESKLLTTDVQDEDLFARAQILQQYFPRSVAYANMLMNNVEDYIETRK